MAAPPPAAYSNRVTCADDEAMALGLAAAPVRLRRGDAADADRRAADKRGERRAPGDVGAAGGHDQIGADGRVRELRDTVAGPASARRHAVTAAHTHDVDGVVACPHRLAHGGAGRCTTTADGSATVADRRTTADQHGGSGALTLREPAADRCAARDTPTR